MINFEYRLLNFPSERLFKPRAKIRGRNMSYARSFLRFQENTSVVNRHSDFIRFADTFTNEFNFNNSKDFNEYVRINSFYKKLNRIKDSEFKNHLKFKVKSALKYPFVFKRMLQGLMLDDTIYTFHLPFFIEAISDLESSFLLIENFYYKQSLQTLRNFIELILAQAYFGLKGLIYEDLDELIEFKMPYFKQGKGSLLVFLKENLIIDSELELELTNLYQELSKAVHSVTKMLNTVQNWNDVEYFENWYYYLTNTCETILKLILKMIEIGM